MFLIGRLFSIVALSCCSSVLPYIDNGDTPYCEVSQCEQTFQCVSGWYFDDGTPVKIYPASHLSLAYGLSCNLSPTCSPVTSLRNVIASSSDVSVGTQVHLTCYTGTRFPDGTTVKVITCLSNGLWDTALDSCEMGVF